MFYAHFVLAKKGPLARIWLAAHWDKKLTKAHVFETNIESSVEGILQPKVKMALRTSGHLLLGIVRIYSRKAKYLLADCNEAFIKIKIAFRPGMVDLPEGNREAAVAAITLPEVFHDFDTALPDITIDMDAQVSLNQSRAEDITLKEDYGNLSLMADDGFDDMGFEDVENHREDGFDETGLFLSTEVTEETPGKPKVSLDQPLKDDGFGAPVGEGILDGGTGVLFEPGGLFDDAPLGVEPDNQAAEPAPVDAHQIQEKPIEPHAAEEDSDDDMYDMGPGCSMGAPSPPSSPESPAVPQNEETPLDIARPGPSSEQPEDYHRLDHSPSDPVSDTPLDMAPPPIPEEMPPPAPVQPMAALDHTTLINNDAESFALAPLDAMIVHGSERPLKAKRKRKLVVDEVKSISGEEMKSQLSDTTDIVATLDLAPPTKRLMHWKETGGVEKLFSLPGHRILSKTLTRSYLRHLTTRSVENEGYGEEEVEDPRDDMSMSKKWKPNDESHPHDDLTHLDSFKLDPSSFTPSLPHHVSIDSVNPSLPHHSFTHHVSIESVNTSHPSMDSSFNELNHIVINDANNTNPPLHSITPSIQSSVEPLHHMQQQMMPPPEFMHHHEPAPLLPPAEHQTPRPINGQDDEATQPLMDQQYPQEPIQMIQQQQQPQPIELPVEPPMAQSQNGMEPPPEQEVPTNIFDSLIGDMPQHMVQQQPQTSNTLNDAEMDMIRNNEFVPSDDDDFDAPASVGPIMPEEQMADETYEQFEERILTKRTTHLLHVINDALDTSGSVSFQHMVRNNKRKQVAQKFYTFLVLKKQQAVELEQNPSYGDLIITKGPKYDTVYNSN